MYKKENKKNINRDYHFEHLSKRFALDAKIFKCRAAIHVENKADIEFWSTVLKHYLPDERFHFIAGSRNEYGRETSGVTQCLKYYKYLSPNFLICIDSDYRYLLQEEGMSADHFVLQTYTYSFENHHCFAQGLQDVCCRVTRLPYCHFNFEKFLTDYSIVIYDLFIWHLYFLGSDPSVFTKYDFNQFICMDMSKIRFHIADNGKKLIDELRFKVEKRLAHFAHKYPKADLEFIRNKYKGLGLESKNTYLFIRGHNIYDVVSCLSREVCKYMLRKEKNVRNNKVDITELYKHRNSVDKYLKQNIKYNSYNAIRKIERDIEKLFKIKEVNLS